MTAEPLLIDAAGVAAMLGMTVQWVRDHTTRVQPILPHVKLARCVRYEPEEVLRFIRDNREQRPKWERQK